MDYDKEFENRLGSNSIYNDFERDLSRSWYHLGAKRAEELLLSDPLVVDLRKVEWPSYAKSVKFYYSEADFYADAEDAIITIPRPKPAWVPQVGEAVFALDVDCKTIFVARVLSVDSNFASIVYHGMRRDIHRVSFAGHEIFCKPFTPENIGKRWGELI
jgi:hypothetical protein